MACENCGEPLSKYGKKYCSRRCSIAVSNRTRPSGMKGTCSVCGEKCSSRVRTCSKACFFSIRKNATLGEYREKLSVTGRHPSWATVHIRNMNRSWNKDLTLLPCAACGYSKHVELAHRKPVSSFPDSALLGTVNDPSNVVQLCRNCHWEFDHLGLVI